LITATVLSRWCVLLLVFKVVSIGNSSELYLRGVSFESPSGTPNMLQRFSSFILVDYDKRWKSHIPISYPKNYIPLRVLLGYDIKNIRSFLKFTIQQSAYRSTFYSIQVLPESSNEYFCLVFGKSALLISLLVYVVVFLSLFIPLSEKEP
jgi:hypothetical protein